MFIIERLISLIAPHRCLGCGTEGRVVCAWCLPGIAPPLPERCYRCQAQTSDSLVCTRCRRTSSLKRVWVRTGYHHAAKQLVHDFKFVRKQAATQPIGQLMAEALPFLPPDTLITYVPTANKRVRQRGYDHARLLAQEVARHTGLQFRVLLSRSGHSRQVGANRRERLRQLEGAFTVLQPADKQTGPVLLVDDLVTTGGTLEAAARCLKKAGFKRVDAVVFAQKEGSA